MAEAPPSKWRMFCLLLTGYYFIAQLVLVCVRACLLIGGLLV